MKKVLLSISSFILFINYSFCASGGPDAYGYIWKDSNEPGGPTFSWWNISVIGSPVGGLADDNFVGPKPLGGNFQYYWYVVDKCWIGSNGYLTFGSGGNLSSPFPVIPSASGVNNYIGAMMSDLNFFGGGNPGRCYYHFNADSFCLSYVNVPFYSSTAPGYTGANSFQIILNRLDNSITFNYQLQLGVPSPLSVSIGIENNSGSIGLQHSFGTLPPTNYSVKYYYPASPSLLVTDGGASYNTAFGSQGLFLKNTGPAYTLLSNVRNEGNVTLTPFTVTGRVLDQFATVIVNTSQMTDSLIPGDDTTITHTATFSPTPPGTYTFQTTISGIAGDAIASNNTENQEIVVVDTTLATIRLNYNNNNTEAYAGSISWTGGDGGVGMYFKPPTYPAKILSTTYMLAALPTTTTAFYAKIYDDNGPGGTAGTLLDSVAVPTASVVTLALTTVPVSSPVVIPSGGIYVCWYMGDDNAAIAYSINTPISNQTYEVLSNFWSDYRDRETQDFFISVDYTEAIPEDVGVPVIVSPTPSQVISAPITVSAWLKNYGTQPDNYFISMNYKLNTFGTPTTEPYTGAPIPPGDSVLFTFTTQFAPPYSGNDTLCVWSYKAVDSNTGNDTSCVAVVLVGINELENPVGVSLYPNPASGNISLQFNKTLNDAAVIRMYDVLGNLVREMKIDNVSSVSVYTYDISHLSNGIYSCRIMSGDKVSNLKIVKAN